MLAKKQGKHPLLRFGKRILQIIFSRITFVVLMILLQLFIITAPLFVLHQHSVLVSIASTLLAVVLVIHVVSGSQNPAYKTVWCILILLFPVFGTCLYLLLSSDIGGKSFLREVEKATQSGTPYLNQSPEAVEELSEQSRAAASQANYLIHTAGYPVYANTDTEYLSPGEIFWVRLLEELQKAEKFIFIEFFIIGEGVMWDSVLRILEEKVAQGVEVRVMYDDVGSLKILPYHYDRTLREKGIRCAVFSPFVPAVSVKLNNRDHRKIVVVDGKVAFTGGINLADEYINRKERFGYWKDAGICLKGDAVWSFTVMFLESWQLATKQEQEYLRYKTEAPALPHTQGFVLPYGDAPGDHEAVGENVYLNLIHKAQRYLYICTPYLIVDNETLTALQLAAKSGVDIRIITPHIPDKWYVHLLTRAYYQQLVEYGVRIFEYTPGFIHSKTFVSDDEFATVGTVNMDFRSMYLHFECGVWMYGTPAAADVKRDFLQTQEQSQEIFPSDCKAKLPLRILRAVFRLFAPLL